MKKCFIILSVVLTACGYDNFGEYEGQQVKVPFPNITIAEIRALHNGESRIIYDDIVIDGYVIANDISGNFYKVFTIDDGTGAIEVRAGLYDLHNRFPVGRHVAIRAKGLAVGVYNNVLQIGLVPLESGGYQTDYFGYDAVMKRYVVPGDKFGKTEPLTVAVTELADGLCGRLVRIEGLEFVTDDQTAGDDGITVNPLETWAMSDPGVGISPQTGYRIFADDGDNTVCIVTSGYADFASKEIPAGHVAITGILSQGKTNTGRTMYLLKMRDINDVEPLKILYD